MAWQHIRFGRAGPAIAVLLGGTLLAGCSSPAVQGFVDNVKDAANTAYITVATAVGIDPETLKERLGDAYESFSTALAGLLDQTGYLFSDLFGDPADEEEGYKQLALIAGCEHAVPIIQKASEATKISANYLLALARQESGCRSDAKASTSTAYGMFQFVESTWLGAVHKHGGTYDNQRLADAIGIGNDGRPFMRNPAMRETVLAKRGDAQLAAYLAAELAKENAAYIRRKRDKPLSPTDLYMAHFLGAYGATQFLAELDRRPRTRAAELLPSAARANPNIFFVRGNRAEPRSVSGVYDLFKQKIERA